MILDPFDSLTPLILRAEQAAGNVPIPRQPVDVDPEDPGFVVPSRYIGLTNAQLQSQFGTSFGGMVPSADAVDAPGDGIVGLIGTAVGNSELPTKPTDIDEDVGLVGIGGGDNDVDDEDFDDEVDTDDNDTDDVDDENEVDDDDENESDEDDLDEDDEAEVDDDEDSDGSDEDDLDEDELDDEEGDEDDLDEEDEDDEAEVDDDEDSDEDDLDEDKIGKRKVRDHVYHNEFEPTDVNNDGRTSPLDAMIVINYLRNHGDQVVEALSLIPEFFVDVNNSNSASPLDAILIINELSSAARQAAAVDALFSIDDVDDDDEEEHELRLF